MKHPDDQQWVSWIFGETGDHQSQELAAHRRVCPECDRRIQTWERTLRSLDSEKIPSRRRSWFAAPATRWAAAAAVLLVGLVTGWASRSVSSSADTVQLRRELQAGWDQQLEALRSELRTEMAGQIQRARVADSVEFLAALTDLQETYSAQISALREDLEVMAFNTHATLEVAEQKLVQLSLDPHPGVIQTP